MPPETSKETGTGEGDGTPVAGPDRGPEENRGAGGPGIEPIAGTAPEENSDDRGSIGTGEAENSDDTWEGGDEKSPKNTTEDRTAVSGSGRRRMSKRDFIRVCMECSGNRHAVSRITGINANAVSFRIRNTPELNALYGDIRDGDEVKAPIEAETLLRDPRDIPVTITDPQLGQMVISTEKLVRAGLATLGVPQSTINKLRAFDGLAVGAGMFLAQSLQDTHQIYFVNLLKLDAMAEDIKKRYLDDTEEAKKNADPLQRMFWQRAYNEIVDQLGKGYDRMLSGTQAMVAMMKAKKKDAPGNARAKPGW